MKKKIEVGDVYLDGLGREHTVICVDTALPWPVLTTGGDGVHYFSLHGESHRGAGKYSLVLPEYDI